MMPRVRIIIGLLCAVLLPATAADKSVVPAFSAELEPYPIHPSAVQSTVDNIHARTVTGAQALHHALAVFSHRGRTKSPEKCSKIARNCALVADYCANMPHFTHNRAA